MFRFKQFAIDDSHTPMKVGTDGVLLGAWADVAPDISHIIDAGSGSGLIALMLAQRTEPRVRITAVELNADAVADARRNVDASPWAERVRVVEEDCLTFALPSTEPSRPLMIVSNPPFFAEALRSPDSGRALARHGDAFDVVSLIDMAARLGAASLAFIAPASRDDDVEFRLLLRRFAVRRRCRVATCDGRPPARTLWQASPHSGPCEEQTLIIRDATGSFTTDYISLTSPFYLDR